MLRAKNCNKKFSYSLESDHRMLYEMNLMLCIIVFFCLNLLFTVK